LEMKIAKTVWLKLERKLKNFLITLIVPKVVQSLQNNYTML
jgi:hypothetical protein